MEFHVELAGATPDLKTIRDLVLAADPAALVDVDPFQTALRVAASLDADELVALLRRGGLPTDPQQVTRVPSVCCGGCSG